ncbi:YadA-like family protein [Veillonella montpellierensis]|uniref:YadA-like family protein n=1 Tax=Veillonella montpellierensis TaxID=187328 RepID=UPI0023F8BCFC|nr:YadA-like family protein [Veillonella montpellierensis]
MNKIFKVIWSQSKQCYVVVSEMANSHSSKKKTVVASVLAALTIGVNIVVVEGADPIQANTPYVSVSHARDNKEAEITLPDVEGTVKDNKNSDGSSYPGGVAIGSYARTRLLGSVAVGQYAIAEKNYGVAIGNRSRVYDENGIAIGSKSQVNGAQSIGIGVDLQIGQFDNNKPTKAGANEAIGIGRNIKIKAHEGIALGLDTTVEQQGGVALGKGATVDGRFSVALGYGSKVIQEDTAATDKAYLSNEAVNNSGNGVVSVGTKRNSGDNNGKITRRIVGVAGGFNDYDAVNIQQLKALENVSLQTLTVKDGDTSTDVTPTDRKITLEAGNNITLTAANGKVTVGTKGLNYMSVKGNGRDEKMTINGVPDDVKSNSNNDGAEGNESIAIGAFARSRLTGSTAIGRRAIAERNFGIALGNESRAFSENTIAIGSKSHVNGNQSIGIGVDLKVGKFDKSGVPTAVADDAVGIGRDVRVEESQSVAVGFGAKAQKKGAVALGTNTTVDSANSVALGYNSTVLASDGATNGKSYMSEEAVNNTGNGVVSVGTKRNFGDTNGSVIRRIVGVAGGYDDYDAVNVKQLKALEKVTRTRFLAISGAADKTEADYPDTTWTLGKNDKPTNLVLKGNFNNEGATGQNSVAVGPWANSMGARSVALGSYAVSNGMQTIALGQSTLAYGENALSLGSYATVNGANSLAIGTDSYVGNAKRGGAGKGISETGDATTYAMAIGFNAQAYGKDSAALGKKAITNGNASVALGPAAQADIEHSVVLGESSLAQEEEGVNTTSYLTNESVNNSGNGVVSIGNATKKITRRIINVAGGTNDYDAVNVKQLKALGAKELHVKTGSYAVDGDGAVTLQQEDGTGTVQDNETVKITGLASKTALDNLKTEVDGKASKDDLTTAVSGIQTELAKKVSQDDMNAALADKANASDLKALTDAVKDKVDVDTLKKFTDTLGKKADEIKGLNDNITRANEANEAARTALETKIDGKLDAIKEAELHTIPGTYAATDDGTITLSQANGTNPDTAIAGKEITITGVATKTEVGTIKTDVKTVQDKVKDIDQTVTDQGTRLTTAENDIKDIKKAVTDKVWTADITDKIDALKNDLSNTTVLKIKGDTTKTKEDTDAPDVAVNLTKDTLTVKGASDEIATAVKGNEITIGLAQTLKDKLSKIDQLGDTSSDGVGSDQGMTGADGLNGKTLTEKVNALRNGQAGSVVYRDDQGNPLRKAKDGKLYKETDVDADGNVKVGGDGAKPTPVASDKIQARLMNPDGTDTPVAFSNVGKGKIGETSTDAVNGAQIYAGNKSVADALGGGAKVNDDGTIEKPTFKVTNEADGTTKEVNTVGDAVTNLDNRITTVATNAKDLKDLSSKGKEVITGLINVTGDKGIVVSSKVDDTTKVKTFTVGLDPEMTAKLRKDIKELKDGPAGGFQYVNLDGEPVVKGQDGNYYKKSELNDNGEPLTKEQNNGNEVKPVSGGAIKMSLKPPVGPNDDGMQLTNVKDGAIAKDSKDAVNGGQIYELREDLLKAGDAILKNAQRVNEVGAHAAALAAMNPLGYDPLRKSQIMAGIGTYDGNQALALGLAYNPNENIMVNAGFTVGEGKMMANIGATYRFGTSDANRIPERYKGGPISSIYVMQDEIAALKAENARKDAENAEMKAQIKMLMQAMGMK